MRLLKMQPFFFSFFFLLASYFCLALCEKFAVHLSDGVVRL